jgi:hypothetical protein
MNFFRTFLSSYKDASIFLAGTVPGAEKEKNNRESAQKHQYRQIIFLKLADKERI